MDRKTKPLACVLVFMWRCHNQPSSLSRQNRADVNGVIWKAQCRSQCAWLIKKKVSLRKRDERCGGEIVETLDCTSDVVDTIGSESILLREPAPCGATTPCRIPLLHALIFARIFT